ncbi:MAG TPA: DUF4394 domain-containing protein, partial [Flavisolibacter sp.]|nr:DUF4394 domain-containing protein [Flavisolibacter sp.]
MKKTSLAVCLVSFAFLYSCQKNMDSGTPESFASMKNKNETMALKKLNEAVSFYALAEGNRLDFYNLGQSDSKLRSVLITGLQQGERILAIDFRPATGQLYGLGSSSRLYVINGETGRAVPVGQMSFTPALSGQLTGFDFNPTVDRIRVVTSSGQNLRLHPETGAVVFVDGAINGAPGAMLSGAAYTNNEAGATSTVLYDIDVASGKLYRQDPPNEGKLVEVGSLGMELEGEGGFDIAPGGSLSMGYT